MLERYVYKNQKKMRCGYTTGTCACAAAKAAACTLLSGRRIEKCQCDYSDGKRTYAGRFMK